MAKNAISRIFGSAILLLLLLLPTIGCSKTAGTAEGTGDSAAAGSETETIHGEIPYTIVTSPDTDALLSDPDLTASLLIPADTDPSNDILPASDSLPKDKELLYSRYIDGTYTMEALLTQNHVFRDASGIINKIIRAYNDGADVTAFLAAPSPDTTRALPPDRTVRASFEKTEMSACYRHTGDGRHKFSFPLSVMTGGNPDGDYLDFYFEIREKDGDAVLEIDDVRIYSLKEKLEAFHPPGCVGSGVFCGRYYRYSFYQFETEDGHLCLYATEDNGDTFTECPITEPDTLVYDRAEILDYSYSGDEALELLVALSDEAGTAYAWYITEQDRFPEFRYQPLDDDIIRLKNNPAVVYPNKNLPAYVDTLEELHLLGFAEDDARIRYIRALVRGDIAAVEELCQVEPGTYDDYRSAKLVRWIAGKETNANGEAEVFLYVTTDNDADVNDIVTTLAKCTVMADEDGVYLMAHASALSPYYPQHSASAKMLYTFLAADGVACRVIEGMPKDDTIVLTALTFLDRSKTVRGPMYRYLVRNIDGIWVTEDFFELE